MFKGQGVRKKYSEQVSALGSRDELGLHGVLSGSGGKFLSCIADGRAKQPPPREICIQTRLWGTVIKNGGLAGEV